MPDALDPLEQLRAHLVTHALVRLPDDAGELPVCRLPDEASDDGHQEPAPGEELVVEIETGPRVPSRQPYFDRFVETRIVDVVTRSKYPWPGELLQRQIAQLLGEERNTYFGELRVEWCRLHVGDQKTGETSRFIERTSSFVIAARLKSLAGEPLTP